MRGDPDVSGAVVGFLQWERAGAELGSFDWGGQMQEFFILGGQV